MSVTLSIILDTRRIKKSNKYPVKLRVTFERVTEYYQTIFDLTKDEYDKLSASRISNELQTIRDKLKEIERTAENSVKDLSSFSFTDFENEFIYNNAILFRPRKLKPSFFLKIPVNLTGLNTLVQAMPFQGKALASTNLTNFVRCKTLKKVAIVFINCMFI
jgi:Arm DNA-binding domain